MADFTYTAKRSIKSGHSSGTDYTITIVLQQVDDEQPSPVTNAHKALDGTEITVLHRIEKYIDFATDLVPTSGGTPDVDDFIEFFNSVAGGESFTYDDGTAQTVIMASKATRQREGLYFTYRFRVRVL